LLERKLDFDTALDAYKAAGNALSGAPKAEALARLSLVEEIRGVPTWTASAEAAVGAGADSPWASAALARARAKQGKADEAAALAQKAASAGGAIASAALGAAQDAQGDLKAAEASYRTASTAEPPDAARVAGSLGLARVLRRTGRAAEAAPV